jgi:hypothetical protein
MSALDSSISWFTMQTIYENIFYQCRVYSATNSNVTLCRRHSYLQYYSATYKDIIPTPTRILLYPPRQILSRYQYRYCSATNRYITTPPTQNLLHHQQGNNTDTLNNSSTGRDYYVSKTDIASPPAQTLVLQQYRF